MVIGGELFEHKKIHLATWKSPGEQYFSQIDHVLIDAGHVSNVMDARAYRGANIDSDHYITLAWITARISNVKKISGDKLEKFDCEKIKKLQY
jgi:hypothetical protein